ncbi:MAG: flagellar assembly protein FliH [Succinivibrionaceae bacterium]|nr:flagellar assembly protein FliH [Succinivibrionaceae bacterium]
MTAFDRSDSDKDAARQRARDSVASLDGRYDQQSRRNSRRENPSDLSAFSPKDDAGARVPPPPRARTADVQYETDDAWTVDPAYRQTNAFGLPKKLSPSAALKQEWPPRDAATPSGAAAPDHPLAEASDYPSNPGVTNALGLPMDWAERRTAIPQDQAQTLRFRHGSSEDVPTNALGIPINWFEQQLAEEEARRKAQEEQPCITQEEIEEIKKNAREEGFKSGYDDGSKKGYDEGFKTGTAQGQSQGYKDGYSDGQEKIAAEMAPSVEFFSSAAEKLAKPLELLDQQISSALVDLAVRLTRQLVPEAAKNSNQFVINSVRQAVEQLPIFSEGVEITVSEHDALILKKQYSEEFLQEKGWKIVVSKDCKDGDIQVSSRDSNISMTLAGQLDSLLREFVRANFSGQS